MHQRDTLRELAVAAADAAGALVVRAHARPGTLTAEVKSPGDYVTEVDRSAEQAAIRVLRAGAPDIAILAEESGGTRHDRMWVIDPVDGTTNFVRGFPVVGVSVAL
ncbi:MAG: inositol monophosphatase family protein, partial [Candidatus Dormiibacterota bacterium]